MAHKREYHIVVLGSGGVGKSCLTAQFVQNVWIESYDPTIEDSYRKHIEVDGRQCILEILDTAGTEQFTAMRELYMKSGQGFLLVFSITSTSSLRELNELREQIVRIKEDETVPIVLVGNKLDLESQRQVTKQQALEMSKSWNHPSPYYETSARRRIHVDDVFKDLCRQIIKKDMAAQLARGGLNEPGAKPSSRDKPETDTKSGSGRRKRMGERLRCTIL